MDGRTKFPKRIQSHKCNKNAILAGKECTQVKEVLSTNWSHRVTKKNKKNMKKYYFCAFKNVIIA